MKALSLIALFFAAFIIFLGLTAKGSAGNVLGNALVVGGSLIAGTVAIIWVILFIKERREK